MTEVLQESNFNDAHGVIDTKTPFDAFLSAKYKQSLAYNLLKNRLPVLLTQIIDSLNQNQEDILKDYGAEAIEDIKQVIEGIGKLKNELVTNKPLIPLITISDRTNDDSAVWNAKLESLSKTQNEELKWFNAIFFISESYVYRRIAQEFFLTKHMKTYDPFGLQKNVIYFEALENISLLSEHMIMLLNTKCQNMAQEEENFVTLLKLNLWGNRSDLYLSTARRSVTSHNSILDLLDSLNKDILVDDSRKVWNHVYKNFQNQNGNTTIDVVLDNSGYELFTDLCVAAFLIEKKLANKIRFYVKCYPWFISDVLTKDFHWLVETMIKSDNRNIQSFGQICDKLLKNGSWTIEEESFWTEPYGYAEMKSVRPSLYSKMSEAILVIIKGDLNYSKVLGDIFWKPETNFRQALRGFEPTNLVCLRTVKSDICIGLSTEKVEELAKEDPTWMYKGRFGLIQGFINSSDDETN